MLIVYRARIDTFGCRHLHGVLLEVVVREGRTGGNDHFRSRIVITAEVSVGFIFFEHFNVLLIDYKLLLLLLLLFASFIVPSH